MQIEVNIDKAAVEAQVASSIINSAIGAQMQDAITKALTEKSGPYGDQKTLVQRSVEGALSDKIRQVAIGAIEARSDEIREQISALLTDDVLRGVTEVAWKTMVGRLNNARD